MEIGAPCLVDAGGRRADKADANADYLLNDLGATQLFTYFQGTFYPDWLEMCSGAYYPGLFPVDSPNDYCLGVLSN